MARWVQEKYEDNTVYMAEETAEIQEVFGELADKRTIKQVVELLEEGHCGVCGGDV